MKTLGKTLGFGLVALLVGTAWQGLQLALVKVGFLSGDPLSQDAGIVTMVIFLALLQWCPCRPQSGCPCHGVLRTSSRRMRETWEED